METFNDVNSLIANLQAEAEKRVKQEANQATIRAEVQHIRASEMRPQLELDDSNLAKAIDLACHEPTNETDVNKNMEAAIRTEMNDTRDETEPHKYIERATPLSARTIRDEPINESEFQLLYMNLEEMSGMEIQEIGKQDYLPSKYRGNYVGDETEVSSRKRGRPRGSSIKHRGATPKLAGRGRPKGSKIKPNKKAQKTKNRTFAHDDKVQLPDRLRKKVKVESDLVIDLTQRRSAPILEKGFNLKDRIDKKTCKLLEKKAISCTFCSKPGNFAVLGPLFGTYKVMIGTDSPSKHDIKSSEQVLHVRLHRDCAVWTPGICLVGSTLTGLGAMLTTAAKTVSSCLCFFYCPLLVF